MPTKLIFPPVVKVEATEKCKDFESKSPLYARKFPDRLLMSARNLSEDFGTLFFAFRFFECFGSSFLKKCSQNFRSDNLTVVNILAIIETY